MFLFRLIYAAHLFAAAGNGALTWLKVVLDFRLQVAWSKPKVFRLPRLETMEGYWSEH
jgi:hypothetical protein